MDQGAAGALPYLTKVLMCGGSLVLFCGLLCFAAFRNFKPSPRQPPSLFLVEAACSIPGFIAGCGLITLYWICFEKGFFQKFYSMLPAGWEEIHLFTMTVGGCWAGTLTGALLGGWLWKRRLHRRL